MTREERFLDFLDHASRGNKPRSEGKTMIMPDLRSPTHDGLLEKHSDQIDIVKILDTNLWAPADVVESEIREYQEHDIEVQVGGMPFELSRLQGKEEQYLEKMEELDIGWVEYETHIADSSIDEMQTEIERLKSRGFNVVGEVGSKWYWSDPSRYSVDRIDVDKTIDAMQTYLDAGCDSVYWEGLLILNLVGKNLDNKEGQKALLDVASAVGHENIAFEVWGPGLTSLEHGRIWSWLVYHFGPEVNIANVPPHLVPFLESIRRGTMYEMDHPYTRWLNEGKPTEDWWRMEQPPYEVGMERWNSWE